MKLHEELLLMAICRHLGALDRAFNNHVKHVSHIPLIHDSISCFEFYALAIVDKEKQISVCQKTEQRNST